MTFTPEQEERIFYVRINDLSSGKFACGICHIVDADIEKIKQHLYEFHASELQKTFKELGLK